MGDATRLEMDLRGEECPIPTIKTVNAIKRLRTGAADQTVVVMFDDSVCAVDISYQAGMLGYSSKTTKTGDSEWEIILTRSVPTTQPEGS
jgi:TusA-related sulfurtransferase